MGAPSSSNAALIPFLLPLDADSRTFQGRAASHSGNRDSASEGQEATVRQSPRELSPKLQKQ